MQCTFRDRPCGHHGEQDCPAAYRETIPCEDRSLHTTFRTMPTGSHVRVILEQGRCQLFSILRCPYPTPATSATFVLIRIKRGSGFDRDPSTHSRLGDHRPVAAIAENYRLAAIVRVIQHFVPGGWIHATNSRPPRPHAVRSPGSGGHICVVQYRTGHPRPVVQGRKKPRETPRRRQMATPTTTILQTVRKLPPDGV
jgi:hypothetical protein